MTRLQPAAMAEDEQDQMFSMLGFVLTEFLNDSAISNEFDLNFANVTYIRPDDDLDSIEIAQLIVITLIQVAAIIGNGVICLSAQYLKRPVSPYVQLCISLAINDLWVSCTCLLQNVLFRIVPDVFGVAVRYKCPYAALRIIRSSAIISSSWHLLALAMYQFFGITWPLHSKTLVRDRHMKILFVFLWLTPFSILLTRYLWDPNDGLRSPNCNANFRETFSYRLPFSCLIIVPLLLTVALYIKIVLSLHANYTFVYAQSAHGRDNPASSKLVNTAVVIVATFFFGYSLHNFHSLLVCKIGCPIDSDEVSRKALVLLHAVYSDLLMLKLLLNPFIYTLRIECFKESMAVLQARFSEAFPAVTRNASLFVQRVTTTNSALSEAMVVAAF